jgi:hypothetical protein
MSDATGFHAQYRTDIDQEINLADNLYIAGLFRYGQSFARRARTDPAALLRRMHYTRLRNFFEVACYIVQGKSLHDVAPEHFVPRPTNAEILTPSHPAWADFHQRLGAELMRPDFDFWYGGARVLMQEEISTEYWPLCSAQVIGQLGCAVAESLCVLRAMLCDNDRCIHEGAQRIWNNSRTYKKRAAFDSVDGWHTQPQ